MKTNEGKVQKPVSMPVIILAVICLGAAVYFMLLPSESGVSVENTNIGSTPIESKRVQSEAVVGDEPEVKDEMGDKTEKNKVVSDRDPFLPSSLYIARLKKDNVPVEPVKPVVPPVSDSNKVTKEKENETKENESMMWKGVVGSKDNQVVLIRHNNKTHLLRLGDLVPGTQYMVAQIASDSVLLISPGQQLRLSKGGKR